MNTQTMIIIIGLTIVGLLAFMVFIQVSESQQQQRDRCAELTPEQQIFSKAFGGDCDY